MTIDAAELLSRELGSARVVRPDSERLADYGRDESPCGEFVPDCAVLCDTADQVALVLRLAAEHGIPVTPRGAGSGMTGGALPVRGGVVLSTERMTRILEIDRADMIAVVEPGLITGDLQAAAEAEGLFYPPDPASLAMCSIGGNVASNAGGPRAVKYGVTREYVLGLDVALMGGEQLRVGRRTVKGVTGYDLVGGFVGTEGTFAVTTQITLKLLASPEAVQTLLAVFPDMAAAGQAIDALLRRGLRPRTLELADRTSIDHVRGKARYRFPENAGAIALIELDGDPDTLEASLLRVGQTCESCGAIDVIVAQSDADRQSLWQARRIISPSLREAHRYKVSEDICVPRGKIPQMLARIDALAARHRMVLATFGHAGDGNLHVNVLVDEDPDDPDVAARIEATLHNLFADTIELGGTLSGEHGIGLAKQRFMSMEQAERVMEWQRTWKRMWDPRELLNPGKIFPAVPRRCHE